MMNSKNEMVPVGGFRLGALEAGAGHRPLLIAEVAQAHDGSLGMAHSFIDAIGEAGADMVKFQTHIAAAESTVHEPWRVKFSPQDATRYDYWKRMELTEEQWRGLQQHAERRRLLFLSSPFSLEAVRLLQRLGLPAWKVASGEVTNLPLLRAMAATGRPVLLSSGMSRWEELDQAVEVCRKAGAPVAVFQCTTLYPCPPEKVGLNVLAELQRRYQCPVGLSDHSGSIYAGLAAAALGASFIEVHVTFSRDIFGPDVCASITFPELKQLAEGIRALHRMVQSKVEKETVAGELEGLRQTFQKSIVAKRALAAGTILGPEDVVLKKAGPGLPPRELDYTLGRRLARAVRADAPLQEADLLPKNETEEGRR